jgi:UDP-N-acetylmuramoylalanine--D-glutamate ligase
MELQGKRALVMGLGKSGVAAALFLESQGARVTVSDSKAEAQLGKDIPRLLDRGIAVETGAHGERTFRDQDLIVISPGVPVDTPLLQQARALKIPVIGEVELASRFLKGSVIAITGSNGKTTTTSLVGELLVKSGFKAQVGGNIGTPVTDLIASSADSTWSVLEISSFQLETVETFRPKIAAILNITPDHLDRHGNFATYVAAKARIFESQQAGDFAVLNHADAPCREIADKVRSEVIWFSIADHGKDGAFVRSEQIVFRRGGKETLILSAADIPLKGAHNLENVLAGVCCAMLAGCKLEDIRDGIRGFKAVEHRLEQVAVLAGVSFYNDSKATNVDATIKALESFPANIHLILGGKDKNSDYSLLNPLLRARVKRVYTIGAAAEKIESQISGTSVIHSVTLERAVLSAAAAAAPGDVVLLAPACASFDQFENYEHRGRVFKEVVHRLAHEVAASGTRHG